MKIIILVALLSTTAFAQWQEPHKMLTTSPEPGDPPAVRERMLRKQQAAQKFFKLPAQGRVLLATLDCSDCVRPLEQLRADKSAVIIIRASSVHVEAWKRKRPTVARVVTVESDEAEKNWFALGVFSVPVILRIERGVIVGVSSTVP